MVARYSARGVLQWVGLLGGPGYEGVTALGVAPDGSAHAAGYSQTPRPGSKDFRDEAFLSKLTAGGTLVWNRTLWSGGKAEAAVFGGNDPTYIAGSTPWVDGSLTLARYDAAGGVRWSWKAGGARASGIAVTADASS